MRPEPDTPPFVPLAKKGAGLLFDTMVRRIYQDLTGERPRGDPVRLLERLWDEGRLSPDAALYLLTGARVLRTFGVPLGAGSFLPAADVVERLLHLGERIGRRAPVWWTG